MSCLFLGSEESCLILGSEEKWFNKKIYSLKELLKKINDNFSSKIKNARFRVFWWVLDGA